MASYYAMLIDSPTPELKWNEPWPLNRQIGTKLSRVMLAPCSHQQLQSSYCNDEVEELQPRLILLEKFLLIPIGKDVLYSDLHSK